MAQVISGEVQCSTYIWARVVVDYSGTSATANIQYRHSAGGYTGYTGSFNYGAGGSSASGSWNNETVSTSWTTKMSIGFSISMSGGTYNVWCSGYDYNDFSVDVSIPAQYTSPSNPTISSVTTSVSTLSGTLSISSWGNPTSGRFEFYFGTTSSTEDDYTMIPASGYSSSKTASVSKTGLDANQHYYVRARVWNQALNNPSGFILFGPYYTLCQAPTFSENTQTRLPYNKVSVSFNYTTPIDSGALTKTLYYSLDGSTWISTGETISTGSQTSGTFTITLPADDSEHIVYLRTTTSAGNSVTTSVVVTTLAPVDITFDSDFKDTNPESVAVTGNDHLFIYGQSILQFTIDNVRSVNNTLIDTVRVTINNRNFTGSTTWTTDAQGITTNDTPIIINYGTIDFDGDKTATVTVTDLEGNSYTHTHTIIVVQRAKIENIIYSFNDIPYYLTSTMTVASWFGAAQKAFVRCILYWTGDNGITYNYTISDTLNVQPFISRNPSKWTATTAQEVSQVTSNLQFTFTLDLTEATGDYSGNTPWQWILDKAKSGEFDAFNIRWEIETENGVDTKSITNLSTPANYEFKLVEAKAEGGLIQQVIQDIDFDLVRFLNDQQLQRNKDIRRLVLVNPSE